MSSIEGGNFSSESDSPESAGLIDDMGPTLQEIEGAAAAEKTEGPRGVAGSKEKPVKNKKGGASPKTEQRDAGKIIDSLLYELRSGGMAAELINQQLARELEKYAGNTELQAKVIEIYDKFAENPDNPAEHEPKWHQWGIIKHTEMFEQFLLKEIPQYLEKWGIREKVERKMSQKIDGISREELLQIAAVLHDLGKLQRQTKLENGSLSKSFKGHEKLSGEIISSEEFSGMLKREYGLTNRQIEYVAQCARLHYELGVVRDEAKKSDMGYTLKYARSKEFQKRAEELMGQYSGSELEVGLLFLADSLAKTDVRIEEIIGVDSNSLTDEQIGSQDTGKKIEEFLENNGLSKALCDGVKQVPVNRAVAETYLKIWAGK